MRAAVYDEFGGTDVLSLREHDPPVGPDTVLVRVKATRVNPVDRKAVTTGSGAPPRSLFRPPERTVARKPPRCRTPQATAVPLAGLTAYQRLVEALDVQHGERVLVHAAAGGIGQFTVQIAMARGAEIVGTASALHHEALASSA